MGINDGTVQGISKILDNGPDNARMNVVLLAEGFTSTEQTAFNNLCGDFVAALQAETWYPNLGDAINIHRLNVASDDSGADEPATCPDGETGSGTFVDTYFDASYCNAGIWRCLTGNSALVRDTLDSRLAVWDVGIVLVNTTQNGGCATGDVSFTNVAGGWVNTALHEMGHNFGLADEYHYWAGCSSGETGQNNAPPGEPSEPNITTETDRSHLKWRHLLTEGVPVPTMENPDCSQCDNRANVISDDDAIGLFEGAGYYHCGRYRGVYRCRMRNSGNPFCRVCAQAIARNLNNYIPATPTMAADPLLLDFGDVVYGTTQTLAFEVRNVRTGRPGEIRVGISNPTGEFSFAPDTETTFTLPAPIVEAHTLRQITVTFTAGATGGPTFAGQVVISRLDDPLVPPITVELRARAVAQPAIIHARRHWNETGILLEQGKTYHFTAQGQWTDGLITIDADGYRLLPLIPFERFRRAPEWNWAALIGTIGTTETTRFLIGTEAQYSPPETGYLYCFANNSRFFYWNNFGTVSLEVTEV